MRIIEKGEIEKKFRCPHCKSVLGLSNGDIKWYKDISGTSSPYVDCPVCGKSTDVEGYRDLRVLW